MAGWRYRRGLFLDKLTRLRVFRAKIFALLSGLFLLFVPESFYLVDVGGLFDSLFIPVAHSYYAKKVTPFLGEFRLVFRGF